MNHFVDKKNILDNAMQDTFRDESKRDLYMAIDLHSNNACAVIIDGNEREVFRKKYNLELPAIVNSLKPYCERLAGIAVEATYNWYWLVDGLKEAGYRVQLAHPAAIEGYRGKKHTNDFDDALNLAVKLKDGKLPQAYIYPKEERPLRDLLRKRAFLVRTRTQYKLSLINHLSRNLGSSIKGNSINKLQLQDIEELYQDKHLVLAANVNVTIMKSLEQELQSLEMSLLEAVNDRDEFHRLQKMPGIGKILALTISLEMGNPGRFRKVGNYLSYCRLVDSQRKSNGKKKGENNRKNGNKYLCWAYIEAANFAIRFCPYARAFYSRKYQQSKKRVIAIKAVAAKIARASYSIMLTDSDYEPKRLWGRMELQS